MRIGIGLPANVPGADPGQVVEWARRADKSGFSSLAVIDRLVFDNYEPLITLAAAAAVTTRIDLVTSVLLAPLRSNAALLAKQVASLNLLAEGRLTLGLGPGGREDDYTASEIPFGTRGAAFDHLLDRVSEIWAPGSATGIGPPAPAPRLLIGGFSPRAFRRTARYADGWASGADGVQRFTHGAAQARAAWSAAGRAGEPYLQAMCYFSVGDDAKEHARRYLTSYYAFAGPVGAKVAAATVTDQQSVTAIVEEYRAAGARELLMCPVVTDPEQVDVLADLVF